MMCADSGQQQQSKVKSNAYYQHLFLIICDNMVIQRKSYTLKEKRYLVPSVKAIPAEESKSQFMLHAVGLDLIPHCSSGG